MKRNKEHTINYLRWIARERNYCPKFQGSCLQYILFNIDRHNQGNTEKVTFFELAFTDEQIELLRNRWYNVPLENPDISHQELLEHKEQIRQSKPTPAPPVQKKEFCD